MDEKDRKELKLDKEHPFPRYTPRDEWLKFRRSVDDNEERIGWGEDGKKT